MFRCRFWLAMISALLAARYGYGREIWAESRLAGSSAGYYHEATTERGGEVVTLLESDLVFNRLGSKVEIRSESRFREIAGRLAEVHSVMSSSAQSTTMDAKVAGNALQIRTTTGGKTYERALEFIGEVKGPEAARRAVVAGLKSPGDAVSYQMFSPELGVVTEFTDRLIARERIEANGQTKQALKVEQTMAAMPGKSMAWKDEDGWLLRQTMPSPFGEIETAVTAGKPGGSASGAALPEESFEKTLVKSKVILPEERAVEEVKILIRHKKPELGWPDFTAENQRVLEQTGGYTVVEIGRVQAPRNAASASERMATFLKPNALLQSDDVEVRAIAAKVVGDEPDPYRAALRLQKWTHENVKFDLGIAIAPASEVVRNRRGTCFGYAVLLASLARAAGIPSRFRMGFAYTHGVWGGHAWVDIRAGNTWIPMDAALYAPGPADAARVSFFTSALEEGTLAGVGELGRLYGNVEIEILEYRLHGKRVETAAARYHNRHEHIHSAGGARPDRGAGTAADPQVGSAGYAAGDCEGAVRWLGASASRLRDSAVVRRCEVRHLGPLGAAVGRGVRGLVCAQHLHPGQRSV